MKDKISFSKVFNSSLFLIIGVLSITQFAMRMGNSYLILGILFLVGREIIK